MRILYIITKSEIGGAQTHIYQLSSYMKSLGNEVAVMSQPGGALEELTKPYAKYYPNSYFSNSLNPFVDLLMVHKIVLAVKDFHPDIISCHSSVAGFLTRLMVRNRIPTIFTAHGWAFTEGSPKWRKILAILAERYAARYCLKIICVSENDRQLATKYAIAPKGKIITIHNGAETKSWNEILELRSYQKKQISSTKYAGQVRIVFVGRLATPKDPIILIKAFKHLPENLQKKSNIFIVGDGPDRAIVSTTISKLGLSDKINILGFLTRDDVRNINLSADIYVLTSNWEGLPRAIIEAMACGLPIISTNVGGCKELVDINNGFLVSRHDITGVTDALTKLITNTKMREQMGKASYDKVISEFSLEKMLAKTGQVYTEVLKKK